MTLHDKLTMLSIIFAVIGGLFGIWGAATEIRDSQDDFIADLKKQGQRNSIAAVLIALSAVALAIEYLMK